MRYKVDIHNPVVDTVVYLNELILLCYIKILGPILIILAIALCFIIIEDLFLVPATVSQTLPFRELLKHGDFFG